MSDMIGQEKPEALPLEKKQLLDYFQAQQKIKIGRSKACDIVIDHPSISRYHISLEKINDQSFWLVDLGSLNGVFVNQIKVQHRIKITPQDQIFIGQFVLSLEKGAKHLAKELSIWAENISKKYQAHYALAPCSLQIPAQSMVAIMGPSGSGKSTLIKALSGVTPLSSGKVYMTGLALNQNLNYLKAHISYVPQEDLLHLELTVQQAIRYAAKLRMGSTPTQEINRKIDELLSLFQIDHIRHSYIQDISGGQRKKLNIAIELLTDPLLLFLDEPTSPLDPQSIEAFLNTLKILTQQGTTVVLVTHKPEDLSFVDEVIFMAEGGHLVYCGEQQAFLPYFGVDHILKVYSGLVGKNAEKWINKYQVTCTQQAVPSAPFQQAQSGSYATTKEQAQHKPLMQYVWLTVRHLNIKLNQKLNLMLLLLQAPSIAFLITLIFHQIELQVLLIMAISTIWFGLNHGIREIVSESHIYKRERMFNQSVIVYLLSKITVLSLFALLQSGGFMLVISYCFKQQWLGWEAPFHCFTFLTLLSLCASMMGLFFSALLSNTEKVMSLIPILMLPQLLLSAVFSPFQSKALEYMSYLTLGRWGTEGLSKLQNKIIAPKASLVLKAFKQGCTHLPELDQICQLSPHIVSSTQSLSQYYHPSYMENFPKHYQALSIDIYALLLLFFLFLILTYFTLKAKAWLQI